MERQLEWVSDEIVRVDGVEFLVPGAWLAFGADTGRLRLLKPRAIIERYVSLIDELRPRNLVELGIRRGGSVGFFLALARPRRYVAIDLEPDAPELDAWLREHDQQGVVRTFYSVDQADGATLRAIADEVFGDEPIDLIIDDASHLYGPTRASFNALFPRLRTGGLYAIEDWSWLHLIEAEMLANPEKYAPPFTAEQIAATRDTSTSPARLLFEQIHSVPGPTNAIDQVVIERYVALARRGDTTVDADAFDIHDCYGLVGDTLVPPLNS